MKNVLDLYWLPDPVDSFEVVFRTLNKQDKKIGISVQHLAGHRLDESKLSKLGRLIRRYQEDGINLQPLRPLNLAIVSNSNIELLESPLIASAARYGLSLTLHGVSLGQAFQQGFEPSSYINTVRPEVVLITYDYRAYFTSANSSLPGLKNSAETIANQLLDLAESFRRNSGATIVLTTLACPPEAIFGSFDRRQGGSLRHTINEVNARLVTGLDKADLILDLEALVSNVGGLSWFDTRQWNHGKFPFALNCLPIFGDHVARLLASFAGKSKKCLVLDFDNTLWGGVIGDDGIEGVELGNGSPLGEAFLDFQRFILILRDRGIIIAGCSKNDDAVARAMFQMHPECLLKEKDFGAFFANWDDKPTNLRRISEQLNIGLDALVFFDDNPFEREIVRKYLPEVTVIEVPTDPSQYRNTLAQSGWFESIAYSEDDQKRNDQYKANSLRLQLAATTDVETYLQSLEMKLDVEAFNSINRQRITQLINKTNQFNTTTRRYSEHEVYAVEKNQTGYCESYRLTDKFGDNGIIGVIICSQPEEKRWVIDVFLMSCRVLNRRVEYAMLQRVIERAIKQGIHFIDGVYVPSGRNGMVANLYENLKFSLLNPTQSDDKVWWRLNVKEFKKLTLPIKIHGR